MAQFQILAYVGTTKVQIAILHTQVVAAVGLFLDGEGRRLCLVQHVQFAPDDFYVARRQVLVLRLALAYLANNLDDPLTAHTVGTLTEDAVLRFVEHQLCDAIAVAQVGKGHAAHLSGALHPST